MEIQPKLKRDSMCEFALIAMLLGMPLFSRAQTAQNSWGTLNTLHVGQRIEIVETNLKKHNGTFSTVTDEAIQLREGGGDMEIKREDVMRVTLLDKSHRLRNALILGAVGAGAGAGIGAAATRCSNSSGPFNFCGVGSGAVIGLGTVIGLAGGAGIGAAIPSHPTIYRIEHH
jgi:hypothetical protein